MCGLVSAFVADIQLDCGDGALVYRVNEDLLRQQGLTFGALLDEIFGCKVGTLESS